MLHILSRKYGGECFITFIHENSNHIKGQVTFKTFSTFI